MEHGVTDQGFSADQIDTSKPHPARMYDYFLGGRDNYEVDRTAAEYVVEAHPEVRPSARANRDFLHRAVRAVVSAGIRQIIDIGTGIPTSPNTHEVAREVAPDVRVAYVDNDPIVATHAGARLTNTANTGFVLADVREPKAILDDPVVRELIDFDQPVGLILGAVLHFIKDEENPAAIVATLAEGLPAGSHLVLTHATGEPHTGGVHDRAAQTDVERVYKNATASLSLRSRAEVQPFFAGFELLEPGLLRVPLWRPDGRLPSDDELNKTIFYGGVGRKV
ncbi:SAM-dependent methyltransferase [Streptomyces sp. H27-D2]|uniref:SAM-dependent methyltransferase n=1 Tax=Streptomyces sp. H27-D2 TaxID=3046304 RepID=UPI002DBA288D|nr:SAM-dependent methyltransferase [Streptomyces sp. H27-D2]MEC4019044.1 SAM-dependent methyltransferase [Streptomyces sp. H27-D2]